MQFVTQNWCYIDIILLFKVVQDNHRNKIPSVNFKYYQISILFFIELYLGKMNRVISTVLVVLVLVNKIVISEEAFKYAEGDQVVKLARQKRQCK